MDAGCENSLLGRSPLTLDETGRDLAYAYIFSS
jgi:hypothetical protein